MGTTKNTVKYGSAAGAAIPFSEGKENATASSKPHKKKIHQFQSLYKINN
jgi:hypothetical protein